MANAKELREIINKVTEISIDSKYLRQKVDRLDTAIMGNGSAAGLKTRVDRLEQVEGNRKWSIRLLWTALVGFLVAKVGAIIPWR